MARQRRADLTRGRVFGAAVDELHLPLTFEFSPRDGQRPADASATPTPSWRGGRATGQAEFDWSGGEAPRLEGNARFNNAEVRSLVKPGGELGSYVVGKVTGRVDFGADSLRSLDDLNATVDATLADSQALQIPVLSVLVPYLAPGQSATTFQQGDLRGRLSRGVFRLQRLTLSSSDRADGHRRQRQHAGPARPGRDGQHRPARLQPRLPAGRRPAHPGGRPHPRFGVCWRPVPYLSNRVIHLRVTGTVRNPDVQLEPVQVLAEEAVRFFVLQSGAPVP